MSLLETVMSHSAVRSRVPLSLQRRWWRDRVVDGPLADCLAAPLVAPDTPIDTLEILSLDLETTGLDPESDEILSIGFAVVCEGSVRIADSRHYLVKPTRPVPEASAVVHGITDDRIRAALPIREALPPLLGALEGRVLLAHYAALEIGFLDRLCRALYGAPCLVPVIDTLDLERRMLERRQTPIRPGMLRLAAIRERYGLPRYRAHDALVDAVATGELLLAQLAYRDGDRSLRDLQRRG